MKGRIRVCKDDRTYTLSGTCPVCGGTTSCPHPARFSPEDRFPAYRRKSRISQEPA